MKQITLALTFLVIVSGADATDQNKIHRVTVLGTGYVGLITGACLADLGHSVICADIDQNKIDLLCKNTIPIYEPGLDALVAHNTQAQRLSFTTNIADAINWADCIIIAVGTPMGKDGCADLSAIYKVFSIITANLKSYKVICVKSTVPVGTGDNLLSLLNQSETDSSLYDLVSNPEFLREGSAIYDFMNPDRIVIGAVSEKAQNFMKDLYDPLLLANIPCVFTNITSAETIKYASNAFLATKLSFINEIANLCDKTGADVFDVALGMGLDKRIGQAFLKPGPGFGGSCFPKDCHALCKIGDANGIHLNVVNAALITNEHQKQIPIQKLLALMNGDIAGKTIAVLGLAFKNNTDDIRYSPAITTIELLLQNGANVKAFDPAAMNSMKTVLPTISYENSIEEAVSEADALIIMTEWDEFRKIDIRHLATLMKSPIIVDTRNLLDPQELKKYNFSYAMMGRP